MNSDKIMYIFYSIIVLILIFCVSIFSNYGTKIINEPTFNNYFKWFIGILMLNLFNILIIFIFYYFKTDIIGDRGLKGEVGLRGQPGEDIDLIRKE